jgi:hypothetical protein
MRNGVSTCRYFGQLRDSVAAGRIPLEEIVVTENRSQTPRRAIRIFGEANGILNPGGRLMVKPGPVGRKRLGSRY